MLRRSFSRLETGVISSWMPGKKFGFVAIGSGEDSKTIFVHQSSIIQARNQRPLHTIRKGVEIQFDIVQDDQGRSSAKNVTAAGGKTLSNRDEIPSTTVDVRALRGRLIDDEDDSRHGQALRGIVQSIQTIQQMHKRTSNLNRNIMRLLNAVAEKEGVKEILTGDEYKQAKAVVLANTLKEAEERRAKRDENRAKGEGEDDEDDVEDEVDEPVETVPKKKEKQVTNEKKGKAAAKKEEDFHSADDLLDLMEEGEATEKKPKGKKGKKN